MKTENQALPMEDALSRAYYYDEHGDWRGPDADERDRWRAVAKVAADAAFVDAHRDAWADGRAP